MNRKKPYIVRLDEVVLTRGTDYADIKYREPSIPSTRMQIGPQIADMSDEQIVELFNATLKAQAELAAQYKHVAVEVPLGSPQIEYFAPGNQWCPRGEVLRCLIEDDEEGQAVVGIDDQELTLEAFGRLLTTYAGWGMRIEFVTADEVHRRPTLVVREPDRDGRG